MIIVVIAILLIFGFLLAVPVADSIRPRTALPQEGNMLQHRSSDMTTIPDGCLYQYRTAALLQLWVGWLGVGHFYVGGASNIMFGVLNLVLSSVLITMWARKIVFSRGELFVAVFRLLYFLWILVDVTLFVLDVYPRSGCSRF